MTMKLIFYYWVFCFNFSIITINSIDAQCEIIWQKTLGGLENDRIRGGGVLPTSYGYLLAGDSNSFISGNKTTIGSGIWLIGLDSLGNILWQKDYCNSNYIVIFSFEATLDNNYIIGTHALSDTCSYKSKANLNDDLWMLKIDELGNLIWEKSIQGKNKDVIPKIQPTRDKGFLVGLSSNSNIGLDKSENCRGDFDYWILKVDSLGNVQWQKTIGGDKEDLLRGIIESNDGYLIGGSSHSGMTGDKLVDNFGSSDYWLLKIDFNGRVIWQREFGGNFEEDFDALLLTKDKKYILAGSSGSSISGNKLVSNFSAIDWWLIGLDSLGNEMFQRVYGGNANESFANLKNNPNNSFTIAGASGSGNSGNKLTDNKGKEDYWILNIDSLGHKVWECAFGGSNNDFLKSILVENDSTYIIAGESVSNISGDKSEGNFGLNDIWVIKFKYKNTILPVDSKDNLKPIIWPNPTNGSPTLQLNNIESFLNVIIYNINGLPVMNSSSRTIDLTGLVPGIYILDINTKKNDVLKIKLVKY